LPGTPPACFAANACAPTYSGTVAPSTFTEVVSGDINGREDVFVRDRANAADVQLGVADAQVREGSSLTLPGSFTQFSSLAFTISLSAKSQQDVSFRYWTEDVTAKNSSDYLIRVGTATIPAGSISTIITVPVIQDFTAEPNETLRLNIDVPVNATIARGQAVGTILNDDSSLTFRVGTFGQVLLRCWFQITRSLSRPALTKGAQPLASATRFGRSPIWNG